MGVTVTVTVGHLAVVVSIRVGAGKELCQELYFTISHRDSKILCIDDK